MSLRAALVGCGRIGTTNADDPRVRGVYSHAGAYDIVAATTLVAVCDATPSRAEAAAKRWGLSSAYTSVAAMLEETRPELVSICSPDETHGEVLARVLETPGVRGVFAEKPITLDVEEGRRLVARAEQRGIRIAVNYVRRYSDAHRAIRRLLAEGGIGAIQAVSGHYTGGVLHNGSHWIDLVRWLFGDVSRVNAWAARDVDPHEVDPSLDVTLDFASGVRATLRGCRYDAFSIFELDVVGTTGRVRIVDSGHRVELYARGESPYYSGYHALLPDRVEQGGYERAMVTALEDLVAAVQEGRDPECSGRDGLAAIEVGAAAIESARTGRPVSMLRGEAA